MSRRVFALCSFLAVLWWVSSAWGQGEEKQLFDDSIDKEFTSNFSERGRLIRGEKQPTKADEKYLDVMAKYYIWRVTSVKAKTNSKVMDQIQRDFKIDLVDSGTTSPLNKGNQQFVYHFGKHLAGAFKEVFDLDFAANRQPVVNASIMFAEAARFKQDEIGKLATELIRDKDKHEIVKAYAAEALGEFLPAKTVTENDDWKDDKVDAKKKKDLERIGILTSYIQRKWPNDLDPDVVRFLRRKAIASLAQVGTPAVAAIKKIQKIEGPAAYGLLRVLSEGDDGITPTPSLSEKIEAAVGVCNLRDPFSVNYDPSAGVFLVGRTVAEFFSEYQKDFVNIKRDPKDKDRLPAMQPWKIQGERLRQALGAAVTNTNGTPAHANALKMQQETKLLFAAIIDGARFQQLENHQQFGRLVAKMKPKTGTLFTVLPGPTLKLEERKLDEEP
ncbi:MAG: hypothetical protein L0Y72_20780 [Gemmataceae bacterium]|nr:hypothetical protein [Gemmataceae bacterium]